MIFEKKGTHKNFLLVRQEGYNKQEVSKLRHL